MVEYYHVLAQEGTEEKWILLFKDLSLKELKKLFLKPFQKMDNILVSGTIYKSINIKKVRVIKTDRCAGVELKEYEKRMNDTFDRLNRESGTAVFFAPYFKRVSDLIRCGNDVTNRFISKAPSSEPSLFSRVVNNQWVVAIVSGLALIAISIILAMIL